MLKTILIVLAVVVVAFGVVVAMQSEDFTVSRSRVIDAPPALVFEYVNDLKLSQTWSPWLEKDPNPELKYSEKVAGEGAWFTWNGNEELGEGKLTIVESKPLERVKCRLEFTRPMKDTGEAIYVLKPVGDNKTEITWTMTSKKDFVKKAFCLVLRPERMVTQAFDKGLANLNAVVTKKG